MMVKLPQKVIERLTKNINKFQKVLQIAKDRDVNEANTVIIVGDILSDIFGFDKYTEITSEFAIRGTYCDLAIKTDDKIQYLIEVKAIGIDLKENHLRQVVDYGVNQGVQWIVLTNGIIWEIYKIQYNKPIGHDFVCSFNLLEINPRRADDQEKLYLLCKESLSKSVREDFHERILNVNRFIIAAIIQTEDVINIIRRELKKLCPGLKVDNDEIENIIYNEILKREVLDGEIAARAKQRIKRIISKSLKKTSMEKIEQPATQQIIDTSSSEKLSGEEK
jgi:predicted type IV restriction endonuclease